MSSIKELQQVTQEVTIGQKCDYCGDEHRPDKPNMSPRKWFYFSTGHSGWGNDSHESIEYFHACSAKCFIGIAKRELDGRLDGEATGEIAEMNVEFIKELIQLTEK